MVATKPLFNEDSRLRKHANAFQAFIRTITKWPPHCFLKRFPTGHMTISHTTKRCKAVGWMMYKYILSTLLKICIILHWVNTIKQLLS